MTGKQNTFCVEYMKDHNATQAAIRAGYHEKTARQQGTALLSNPSVKAAIAELDREHAAAAKVTADMVINGLSKIAFSDSPDTKDSDRNKALELLGKTCGAFSDNLNVHTSGRVSVLSGILAQLNGNPEDTSASDSQEDKSEEEAEEEELTETK